MVKVQDIYPIDTVVRLKKTGQFAIIKQRSFLNSENFLNYLAIIEGRGEHDLYAVYQRERGPRSIALNCLNKVCNLDE